MSSYDVVRLCGHYRLARMLEREDFRSRLDKNLPISVHELLYPLLTAYDAVALKSDVELGATEQKFNMLVHREIQREYGQTSRGRADHADPRGARRRTQNVEEPRQLRRHHGSARADVRQADVHFSDELMWSYYELLTDFGPHVILRLREEVRTGTLHPMDAKMQLAHAIIAGFHGEDAAKKATEEFQRVFRDRQAPEEAPPHSLQSARELPSALSALLVRAECSRPHVARQSG